MRSTLAGLLVLAATVIGVPIVDDVASKAVALPEAAEFPGATGLRRREDPLANNDVFQGCFNAPELIIQNLIYLELAGRGPPPGGVIPVVGSILETELQTIGDPPPDVDPTGQELPLDAAVGETNSNPPVFFQLVLTPGPAFESVTALLGGQLAIITEAALEGMIATNRQGVVFSIRDSQRRIICTITLAWFGPTD